MLPITTVFASLLALLALVLASRVVDSRRSEKVSLGDGGNELVQRRMRAQGNFNDYVPMTVILVGLAEFQNANFWLLAGISTAFLVARVAHGYAMAFTDGWVPGRFYGTVVTFLVIGFMALLNLVTVIL